MEFRYREAFKGIEESLLAYGSQRLPREEIQAALDRFKTFGQRELTDEWCFANLIDVVFYSGMLAATVTCRLPVIHQHLADFCKVADYGPGDIERILADEKMLRNRRKIEACVQNAKVMRQIVEQYGSFAAYLAGFDPKGPFENLLLLKEDLEERFAYLGSITVYHFMTNLGLPVLKPDRVIVRIMQRLGLISRPSQHLKAIIHGRKFAESTDEPIRYIDIVMVAYGQVRSTEYGIDKGICLEKEPRCSLCGVQHLCSYYQTGKRASAET
ncbi:MAG: DNA-3-methyladenine glycosylase I [Planctomycetota bacterium]